MGAGVDGADLSDADVVVFATPDTALVSVAALHDLRPDQVALHLSGALPSTVLAPTGARTAGLHPLRAFADLDTSAAALPGTWCFVEGAAVDVAERLASDFGGRSVRIDTAGKVKYHAAAAIASNFTVTLLGWARELFAQAGVGEADALAALSALAAGAVENVARVGLPDALTGPAARGDVEIVRGHLAELDAGQRELYRLLLLATLPLARAKGGLSEEAARELERLAQA
jgi:predicted short-subunit dehydrogenase-like oxidoreductase (DUF2520 family)